jgi:ribosome-associated protein
MCLPADHLPDVQRAVLPANTVRQATERLPTRPNADPMSQPRANHLPLARQTAQLCADYKANDIVLLDLRGVSDMTDFFLVASGTSDTHVRSVAQNIMDDLRAQGQRPAHVEGLEQGRWVLLDYVDMVVHVFHPTLRQFYQLERLWSDAAVVPLDGSPA